jgi:hypothetical protein
MWQKIMMVSGYRGLEEESFSSARSFGDSSMSGVGPEKGRPRLFFSGGKSAISKGGYLFLAGLAHSASQCYADSQKIIITIPKENNTAA